MTITQFFLTEFNSHARHLLQEFTIKFIFMRNNLWINILLNIYLNSWGEEFNFQGEMRRWYILLSYLFMFDFKYLNAIAQFFSKILSEVKCSKITGKMLWKYHDMFYYCLIKVIDAKKIPHPQSFTSNNNMRFVAQLSQFSTIWAKTREAAPSTG